MSSNDHSSKILDKLADFWERSGHWCGRRPVQLLSYFVSAMILVGGATYFYTNQTHNTHDIRGIKASFCSGAVETQRNTTLCQNLLDKLLEHPTNAQQRRLRQLMKETR